MTLGNENGSGSVGGLPHYPTDLQRELNLILKEIRLITNKMKEDDDAGEVENDWKFAAMVLDRLCLVLFTLFTLTATVALLVAAPHVFA